MHMAVCFVFLLVISILCQDVDSSSAIYYDLRSYTDYDTMVYMLTLQGNMNKLSDLKLYFQTNMNMQYTADDYWVNVYLPQNKNISFDTDIIPSSKTDICTLTNAFSKQISDYNITLIIYDYSEYNALQYLALTYSGLYNLLPVTETLYKANYATCLNKIQISKNITNLTNSFNNNLQIYQYMIDNIMPSCNNTLAFSAGKSYKNVNIGGDPGIVLGLDIVISLKAFLFNLSPDPVHYANQSEMFVNIMNNLRKLNDNDVVEIYGWAEPEPDYSQYVSDGGNVIMCAASPNLSFWNKLSCSSDMRLPNRTNTSLKLNQSKYYIAFQTNEGDTPKVLDGLYAMTWISELRGTVPVSWGVDPRVARLFPSLVEFYATSALYNDSFFAGVSGAGYCYPFSMPNFDIYAKDVNYYLRV